MSVTSIEKNAAGLILCFVWRHLIFLLSSLFSFVVNSFCFSL
ncbi:hypothetical protein CLOL250_02115 [Clostridium sp. L2-50]|nr:hypothetical protein CLOL250_02115 [Clostridium sp. L2-50]